MKRRTFFLLTACAAFTAHSQEKVRVVGVLSLSAQPTLRDEVFHRRLQALGWREGRNVRFEYRRAANDVAKLPAMARELVTLKVDVIVAQSTPALKAAKDASAAIPIVSISADPVGTGLVESLARPGGNVTGVSMMMPALAGKRLEVLKEMHPKLARVAFLAHGGDPAHTRFVQEAEEAAQSAGMRLVPIVVKGAGEFEAAFAAMRLAGVEALIVQPLFVNTLGYGRQLADLAIRSRLLTIGDADMFAEEGGLLMYGPDPAFTYERVATFVDRVLKGAKPAELPIELPQRFLLLVNAGTAKKLGITVPRSLLMRADRVIE